MGCSGCGHHYNPGSAPPVTNKVTLPKGQVRGRYVIKPVPAPPILPAPLVRRPK